MIKKGQFDNAIYRKVNLCSKETSGTVRVRTQNLFQTSKGKMDKRILAINKITDDKEE